TALTRSGTVATATVTAHGYSTGQTIQISGADSTTSSAYNGSYSITVLNANQFKYTISDSPVSPGSGGTVKEATTHTTATIASITRTSTSGNTTAITVTATGNLPSGFSVGRGITISGATPSNFTLPNSLNTTTSITALGKNCPSGTNNKSLCFTMTTF